jgi:hypothetical protein
VSLAQALGDAFDTVSDGLQALDRQGRRKKCNWCVGVQAATATIRV